MGQCIYRQWAALHALLRFTINFGIQMPLTNQTLLWCRQWWEHRLHNDCAPPPLPRDITVNATELTVCSGWVAKSAQNGPHMWEIRCLVPHRVKPMTYKIDTCHSLPSLVLGINRIRQGLVSSVSRKRHWMGVLSHGAGSLVSQWDVLWSYHECLCRRYPSWYDPRCCKDI